MNTPPERLALAREWFSKAAGDLKTAEHTLTLPDAECPFDTICFHAQQCAEKSLKAFLIFQEVPFGRTHDLGQLLELCTMAPDLIHELDEMDFLSPYAVETRYPGDFEPFDRPKAQQAVALAKRVHEAIWRRLAG